MHGAIETFRVYLIAALIARRKTQDTAFSQK